MIHPEPRLSWRAAPLLFSGVPCRRHVTDTRNFEIKEKKRLDIKRAEREARDARYKAALAKANERKKLAEGFGSKRKENRFLLRYLSVPLESMHALRPESSYRARSYNMERQVIALLDHLFARYKVPLFLYRTVLSYEGIEMVFGEKVKTTLWRVPVEARYREWFLAVARGDSFAKVARAVFNKREAHWFLQAPALNSIEDNIFWAKAAAAGVPLAGCDFLVERFNRDGRRSLGDRLPDLLRFYAAEWDKMRRGDREEITDFLREAIVDSRFSLKGRTYGSVRKLCEEWHWTQYSEVVREYRSWSQRFEPWEKRSRNIVVRAFELTNNRALSDEGRKQCHCVYGYTDRCLLGDSRIVSIRWYAVASADETPSVELTRLTIEVLPRLHRVIQIRGKLNRSATEDEMKVVRAWAGTRGVIIDSSWWD